MKKKLLLAAVSLVALSAAAPALAADLAARPYTTAPPAAIAAVYDLSGFYIGLNGGGGWAHTTWDFVGIGREGSHDATGGTVGGQIGYRWQSGQFVFGLEGQGNWADFSGDNVSALFATRNRTKIDAFGLITGQVGYAWNNVLLYVKGGAAVVSDKYEIYDLGGPLLASTSQTRWGGTVGVGLEYGFAPNWSVGVEYNHIFLADKDVTFAGFAGTERIRQDVDMALVRLNYKFGGPMVARY